MAEKRKASRAEAITYCICAVAWNINLFLDIAYGNTNSKSFVWHIVFAVVWNILAIVWVLWYRKSKKDNGVSNTSKFEGEK